MTKIITILAALFAAAGLAAGTATASTVEGHPGPGDLRTVCDSGQTVSFYGSRADLAAYLSEHEGSTLGACPDLPPVVIPQDFGQTFLCMSHFGGFPIAFDWADVAHELAVGWFVPAAILGHGTGPQDIVGAYRLACNVDGLKATGTGLNGSGGSFSDFLNALAFTRSIAEYGVPGNGSFGPVNHYQIYQ